MVQKQIGAPILAAVLSERTKSLRPLKLQVPLIWLSLGSFWSQGSGRKTQHLASRTVDKIRSGVVEPLDEMFCALSAYSETNLFNETCYCESANSTLQPAEMQDP